MMRTAWSLALATTVALLAVNVGLRPVQAVTNPSAGDAGNCLLFFRTGISFPHVVFGEQQMITDFPEDQWTIEWWMR